MHARQEASKKNNSLMCVYVCVHMQSPQGARCQWQRHKDDSQSFETLQRKISYSGWLNMCVL